jgi:phosphinothricin acetyltransferase
MEIRKLLEEHYPRVRQIYLEGIATGQGTFETEAPSWEKWNVSHLEHGRIVALDDRIIVGWAALTPVSDRCVYAGVAEVSVYVALNFCGKGVGDKLLKFLVRESESHNIWTLQAGIFPENEASLRLHYKNGFRTVGIREKVGKMNNTWRDTVLLERRSKSVGLDQEN